MTRLRVLTFFCLVLLAGCGSGETGQSAAGAGETGSPLPGTAGGPESRVQVWNTHVSLVPPPGFEHVSSPPGFVRPQLGAEIHVSEQPARVAASQSAFAFAEAKLRAEVEGLPGVKVLSSDAVTIDGGPGVLFHIEPPANAYGGPTRLWIALFVHGNTAVEIAARYRITGDADFVGKLRAAVLSARWRSDSPADPTADLPFTIDLGERLRFARRVGNAVDYTETGGYPPLEPLRAHLRVNAEPPLPPGSDAADYARELLGRARSQLKLAVAREVAPLEKVADAPLVYRESLECSRAGAAASVSVRERVVFGEEAAYVLVGCAHQAFSVPGPAGKTGPAPVFPAEFERVAATFRLR